ncbi:MAG: T9SS type A sorting domain-containing protein [Bacteroidetes bacterium]|nr:T9SS type A sorting domain-containing protein [Bacteroidota bacterium]
MKKTLAIALALVAVGTSAFAQQRIEPRTLPLVERTSNVAEPPSNPNPFQGRVAEERSYRWYSRLLARFGPGGDTNRRDLTVPLDLTGVEMRGFGQIMPNPTQLYAIYNGSIYNANSSSINLIDTGFATDQDYIDQFKDASTWTIEAVRVPYFKNPYNTPSNPGLFTFYKTTYNFRGNTFKQNGFFSGRSALTKVRDLEINVDGLDSTIATNDQGDSVINPTLFVFDGDPGSGNEPMTFAANESALLLYVNEFAPAVTQPVAAQDTREFQRLLSSEEYRAGDFVPDPNNPGEFLDQRTGPLDSTKIMGLVMFRAGTKDSVYSTWGALQFGGKRALINTGITFFGSVTLSSGVKYYYGSDASQQGIGAISPNPVRDHTTIPFSLTTRSNVTIDLYNAAGEHVKNVVDNHYVDGKYSVDLSTDGLPNGFYVVRMIAGDKVYTSKINIAR